MSGYSAVSAKIKAMYANGLKVSDFEALLSKNSVKEVCDYLKNETTYSDVLADINDINVHRGAIEQHLWLKFENEYKKIYNFIDSDKQIILDSWYKRKEVQYLRHYMRNLFNKETNSVVMPAIEDFSPFFRKFTKIDVEALQNAKTFDDFIVACKNTSYEAYLTRAKNINADYFSITMGLDALHYGRFWKICEKNLKNKEKEVMQKLLGTEIDMLNIKWIYRSKKYFRFDESLIYTYLLPVRYRLSENIIKEMVNAKSDDDIIRVVEKTPYKHLFDNLSEGIYIDENYYKILNNLSERIFREKSDTIAGVIAYLETKQIEILNIIKFIETIRYNINPDVIRKHIGF